MKKAVLPGHAPKPVGPYSQAVRAGDLLFLSGQVAIDPSTGKLVQGGVEKQTGQIMENLQAVLAAEGVDFSNVVKTTIFLTDMTDFTEVNRVYGMWFPIHPPARSTVQVAALPLGARLEIEMVAFCGTSGKSE